MRIHNFFILSGLLIFACSCIKEPEIPKTGNKIVFGNTTADSTSYNSIWVSSEITSSGAGNILQHGHCWSTDVNPDTKGNHSVLGNLAGPGKFTDQISNLNPAVTYYIRAYVTYAGGTLYGQQVQCATKSTGKPSISKATIVNLRYNGMEISATVTSDGGATVTKRGVCWNTGGSPSLSNCLGSTDNGQGTGTFNATISNLSDNTPYFVASYAINSVGTSYGDTARFSTLQLSFPQVTITTVQNFGYTSTTVSAEVTSEGNDTVSVRGFCWNKTGNPTLENSIDTTVNGSGLGIFSGYLHGLKSGTDYFIAAYAINHKGIANGASTKVATKTCNNFYINHIAGNVAPVNKSVTYSTVVSSLSGEEKCWLTQNLGANHMATAVDDATESSAGWYWQYNRKKGYKHDGTTLIPAWTIPSIDENSDWLSTNDPCSILLGSPWRIPTYTEWSNVDNTGGWANWLDPWNSELKLHAAGCLNDNDGLLSGRGSAGYYWSSTQYSSTNGFSLLLYSFDSEMFGAPKAYGQNVRCLRDN